MKITGSGEVASAPRSLRSRRGGMEAEESEKRSEPKFPVAEASSQIAE